MVAAAKPIPRRLRQSARDTAGINEPETKTPSLSPHLLAWYDIHARQLPWRVPPGGRARQIPYRVWVSEIMLQQTTVATVKARYGRFLELWPTLEALAAAPLEAVLKEWAGLGYYARARNLHKCARTIREQGGAFPRTEVALQELPGIGPYTAAAIAAIAFDVPAVVLDGNIERVMARLFEVKIPLPEAKPVLKDYARRCTPQQRAGDYAQALMDLGATICAPRTPLCAQCPLNSHCTAFNAGSATELPRKRPKGVKPVRRAYFYLAKNKAGEVLTEKRPTKGLLGGMPGLPTHSWEKDGIPDFNPPFKGAWHKRIGTIRHTFTHFHLEIEVWDILIEAGSLDDKVLRARALFWQLPHDTGFPTVFKKVLLAS